MVEKRFRSAQRQGQQGWTAGNPPPPRAPHPTMSTGGGGGGVSLRIPTPRRIRSTRMRGKRWIVSFFVLRVRCRHLSQTCRGHRGGDRGPGGDTAGRGGGGEAPASYRGVLRVQLLLLGEEAEAVVERDLPPGKALLQGHRVRSGPGWGARGVGGGSAPSLPLGWAGRGRRRPRRWWSGSRTPGTSGSSSAAPRRGLGWGEIEKGETRGGEGHPEGFRGGPGGDAPTRGSPTILLSSRSRYRFHIWLARSSSLRGEAAAQPCVATAGGIPRLAPHSPPTRAPSCLPSPPQRLGVLQRGGPPGVREDAGGPAALAVDLHVQPVHEELEELLGVLLAVGGGGGGRWTYRTPCPGAAWLRGRGIPGVGGHDASPVAGEGGDVFLKDGLEAPGVDCLGGVGVPQRRDDVGERWGGGWDTPGGSVPPAFS